MSNNSSQSSGGVGFVSLLAILFIALKLTGHIDWSWVWVLAPLWMPLAVGLSILSLVLIARGLETTEQRKIRKAQEALDAFAKRYGNK